MSNLYKLVGRSWTVRVVTWNRGKPAQTEYRKQEITLVHEDLCTVKTSDPRQGRLLLGGDQARDLRFNDELKAASTPAKDSPKLRVAAAGASFECTLSEFTSAASHEQTWRSTKFPALIVRQRIVRADYVQTLDLLSFNEGVPDAWTLYRMAGRKWVYRVNEELTGTNPKTSYLVNEVVESTLQGAKVKISHLDKEKKPVEGDLGDTITIDFEKSTPWKKPEKAKDQDVIEGTLSVARIKWASIEVRGSDQSEFYSKNWPGLLLKKTLKNSEMAPEEFYTATMNEVLSHQRQRVHAAQQLPIRRPAHGRQHLLPAHGSDSRDRDSGHLSQQFARSERAADVRAGIHHAPEQSRASEALMSTF